VSSPISNINDGYEFQRIVAEYFRSLKNGSHKYDFTEIDVESYGVGVDDGCDILVEFKFYDGIGKHKKKWIIECKSQTKAVGPDRINRNRIDNAIQAKSACGYLLVCKSDATTSLKRMFDEYSRESEASFVIWNGSQLWHRFIESKSLIQAFFPEYYQANFRNNNAEESYLELINKYEKKLKMEDKV
jgi:hypothetical protein